MGAAWVEVSEARKAALFERYPERRPPRSLDRPPERFVAWLPDDAGVLRRKVIHVRPWNWLLGQWIGNAVDAEAAPSRAFRPRWRASAKCIERQDQQDAAEVGEALFAYLLLPEFVLGSDDRVKKLTELMSRERSALEKASKLLSTTVDDIPTSQTSVAATPTAAPDLERYINSENEAIQRVPRFSAPCQRCNWHKRHQQHPEYVRTDPRSPVLKTEKRTEWLVLDNARPLLSKVSKGGAKKPFHPNSMRARRGVDAFPPLYHDENVNADGRLGLAFDDWDGWWLARERGPAAVSAWQTFSKLSQGQPCVECGGTGRNQARDFPWQSGPRNRGFIGTPSDGSHRVLRHLWPLVTEECFGRLLVAYAAIELAGRQLPAPSDYYSEIDTLVTRLLEGHTPESELRPWAADATEYSGAAPEPTPDWLPKREVVCDNCGEIELLALTDAWGARGRMLCDSCLSGESDVQSPIPPRLRQIERTEYLRAAATYAGRRGLTEAASTLGISEKTAEKREVVQTALHVRRAVEELLILILRREGLSVAETREFFLEHLGEGKSKTTIRTVRDRGHINPRWLSSSLELLGLTEATLASGAPAIPAIVRFLQKRHDWTRDPECRAGLRLSIRDRILDALGVRRPTADQLSALNHYLGVGAWREGRTGDGSILAFQGASDRDLTRLAGEIGALG